MNLTPQDEETQESTYELWIKGHENRTVLLLIYKKKKKVVYPASAASVSIDVWIVSCVGVVVRVGVPWRHALPSLRDTHGAGVCVWQLPETLPPRRVPPRQCVRTGHCSRSHAAWPGEGAENRSRPAPRRRCGHLL